MSPNGKRQQLSPPDLLSNIQECLMDDILMRLPFRDAVRTSILSRKWRYNWCRLPELRLDGTLQKTKSDLIIFTKVIYHISTLHVGPIPKFTLSIPELEACPNIDNLFYFLSGNGIQHLILVLPWLNKYKLPSSFFACLHLRHLTLSNCLIRLPPAFKGFDRLIYLKLIGVTISSEMLGSLISHCPLLEHLVLQRDHINCTEISAPNLRSFFFEGDIKLLHLKNVPLLSKVSYVPVLFTLEAEDDLAKIFERIPALENLSWTNGLGVMDVESVVVIPARLPSALNCLKRLYLCWIDLGEFFELSFALCLIRSSPNLEEIELKVCGFRHVEYGPKLRAVVDEIPASFSDTTFNHLRTIKISNVAGARAELQLIKVLLVKSPALATMVINPRRMENKKSLNVLAEIAKFQRASSQARVVYNID